MFEAMFNPAAFAALIQVLMIDLVLAGDNAVAVGLAAGGLPEAQRKKAILWGLIAAVVHAHRLRPGHRPAAGIIGLLLAGGLLLLWVCWKMWRELREQADADEVEAAAAAMDDDPTTSPRRRSRRKSFRDAFLQILIADISMSLDNVLAVAGAAREHPGGPGVRPADVDRPDGCGRKLDRPPAAPLPLDRLRRPDHRAVRRPAHDVGGPSSGDRGSRLHARNTTPSCPTSWTSRRRGVPRRTEDSRRSRPPPGPPKRSRHSATWSSSILRNSTSGAAIARPGGRMSRRAGAVQRRPGPRERLAKRQQRSSPPRTG